MTLEFLTGPLAPPKWDYYPLFWISKAQTSQTINRNGVPACRVVPVWGADEMGGGGLCPFTASKSRRICGQPDCQEPESGGQGQGQGGGVGFWMPGGPRLVRPSPSIPGAFWGTLWMGCAWGSQGCR